MQKEKAYNSILMFKFKDLHRVMYNKANKLFANEGMPLSIDQLPVLMTLFYTGTLSQQEIADKLERDKSSVLRSAKSLQSKNLIEIAQNPFDKRKKMVQLTKEGHVLGASINEKIIKIDSVIFSCLSDEEKKTLEDLIVKCTMSAREE